MESYIQVTLLLSHLRKGREGEKREKEHVDQGFDQTDAKTEVREVLIPDLGFLSGACHWQLWEVCNLYLTDKVSKDGERSEISIFQSE